jgi:hypothetical protein
VIRTPAELFEYRLRMMLWIEQTLAEEILPPPTSGCTRPS